MNKGILEALIAEIKAQGDLPALSVNIKQMLTELNRPEVTETSLEELVPLVSSDIGLTKSVFSLVNSPMYSAYGGDVKTLSKALLILGTDALTHLAVRQRVAETVLDPKKVSSRDALKSLTLCVNASALGRQIASKVHHPNPDQLSLQCLLAGIGKLLVATYLPSRYESLGLVTTDNLAACDTKCFEKFSLSFSQIGRALCSSWGIPMATTPDDYELVNLIADAAHASVEGNGPGLEMALQAIESSTGVPMQELVVTATECVQQSDKLLSESGVNFRNTVELDTVDPECLILELESMATSSPLSAILGQSIEVLKRILKADNACAFVLSPKTQRYTARLCFGEKALQHKGLLEFDCTVRPDLFSLAVRQEKPFYVSDIRVPGIREKLPVWFLSSLYETANAILMIPVVINGKCLAAYYLDWNTSQFNLLSSTQQQYIIRILAALKQGNRAKQST